MHLWICCFNESADVGLTMLNHKVISVSDQVRGDLFQQRRAKDSRGQLESDRVVLPTDMQGARMKLQVMWLIIHYVMMQLQN